MPYPQSLYRKRILPAGLFLWLLFAAAWLFPEKLWAINYLTFLSPLAGGLIMGLALAAVLYPAFASPLTIGEKPLSKTGGYMLIAGIAICAGIIFYALPVETAAYGDGYFIQARLGREISQWDPGFGKNLFSMNLFDPKIGYKTFYGYTEALAGISNTSALEWLGITQAVAGSLFTGMWLLLADHLFSRPLTKIAVSAAGLSAPILIMFMGLPEMYAMPYMVTLGTLCVLILAIKDKGRGWFVLLYFCVLLSIKLHISGWFLLPMVLLASLYHFLPAYRGIFSWKNVLLYLLIPGTLAALFLYLSSVGGLSGQRLFTEETIDQVTFLPVIAEEGAPLDRYGLLSFNHLFDLFNILLIWSPALFALLLICVGPFRKSIDWNRPELLLSGTGLITYLGMFFLVNPLMSMPFDWDLFSLPAPLLWVFTALASSQLAKKDMFPGISSLLLGLSLLSLGGFGLHQSHAQMGERFQTIGRHSFKTYWISSSKAFGESALQLKDSKRVKNLLDRSLADLEPHVTIGVDAEYAAILLLRAQLEFGETRNDRAALPWLQKAHFYAPYYDQNNFQLVVSLFRLKKVKEAEEILPKLLLNPYPNREKCLQMAVHISLEAENYPAAETYTRDYLALQPQDHFFREVLDSIHQSRHPERLKFMFAQPE